MPEPVSGPTFGQYLWAWWRAAWAPAYDKFGVAASAVGLGLWLWRKLWPENFQWAAQQVGFTPETAMNDLVWIVPVAFGFAILGYRLVRAPFEIHRSALAENEELSRELRTSDPAPNVQLEHGRTVVVWDEHEHLDEFWVVIHDLTITNCGSHHLPLDFEVYFGGFGNSSLKWGCRASHAVPPTWVLVNLAGSIDGFKAIPNPLNLPGLTAERGYLSIAFHNGNVIRVRNDNEAGDAITRRPIWIRVKNRLTGAAKDFPVNPTAGRLDAGFRLPDERNA